jgi:hypothetical protein
MQLRTSAADNQKVQIMSNLNNLPASAPCKLFNMEQV